MTIKKLLAAAAAATLAFTACGSDSTPGGGGDAPENNNLVLYSSMTENDLEILTGLLEKAIPGIEVEVVNGSAGELTTRIRSEAGNPQGDMMWGGLDTLDGDKNADIFEAWLSDHEGDVQPQYKSPNGFYNVDHLSSVAFAVNNNLEKELGIQINGYADLLDPKLKGKIVMADPTSSSSAWNNISNIMAVYGNDSDEAWAFIKGLLENDVVIAGSSSAAFASVEDGEYVVGLTYEDGIASLLKSGAKNIRLQYPKEGTSASAFGTAVIKGGPNPELAKKAINYIMSPEGQVAFGEAVGTVRMTTSAEIKSEFLPPSSEITWVDRDIAWLTANRDAVVAKWTELYTQVNG
ncbi:MAG: extracellular solute-binding protein [Arachnia sp.]